VTSIAPVKIDTLLRDHYIDTRTRRGAWLQAQRFRRDGFLMLREIVPDCVRAAVREEVLALLDRHAERRDLRLATTDYTPRRMSVVPSETIAAEGELIGAIYRSPVLRRVLEEVADEGMTSCPSKDEEFLITRQERVGDTHGWHWGDYSFALIWIIETPPVADGGMLQCVPHTRWNKSEPLINEYLCENPIATYGFRSGDVYFLRTDTTLHRTVPLNREATRIILNMTWASRQDMTKPLRGDDRWWDEASVSAAAPDRPGRLAVESV